MGRQVVSGLVVESKKPEKIEVKNRGRIAAQYGKLEELDELLDNGELNVNDIDDEGCTLLQWASINNRVEVVEALLRRGADPKMTAGILKETALHWAARQGHLEPVVLLREAGCEASARGVEGVNAVHLACRYGKHVVLAYLLARDEVPPGCDGLLDLPDDRGRTPLMVCVEWYWNQARSGLETMRVLVALGCSINVADAETGRTALHFAAERPLDRTALETLVEAGASLEAEDGEGKTAEMVAISHGHREAARTLRAFSQGRSTLPCLRRWRCFCCSPKEKVDTNKRMQRDALLPETQPQRASPASSRAPSLPVALYGFFSPWVGLGAPIFVAQSHGWQAGAVSLPIVQIILVSVAPRGSGRYGMCGFAGGSIALIVASFATSGAMAEVAAPLTFLYFFLVSCLAINFVLAIVVDPGVIDPPRQDRINRIVKLARDGKLSRSNLCPSCLIEKPPRSKHDPTLGKCVRRFDHFCPYVANVVGQNNYLYFYLFLFFVVLAIALHLALVVPRLHLHDCFGRPHRTRKETPMMPPEKCLILERDGALLLVASILAVVHIFWVSALCLVHTSLVMTDTTTYETVRHSHGAKDALSMRASSSPEEGCCTVSARNARNSLCPKPPSLEESDNLV